MLCITVLEAGGLGESCLDCFLLRVVRKTPFQSFLGIAQQHSSHNGVSQGWGVGAGGWLAGATGQGQASASGALSLVLGPTQAPVQQAASPTNPTAISPDEYFDPNFSLESRNIGRPIEMSSKVQR